MTTIEVSYGTKWYDENCEIQSAIVKQRLTVSDDYAEALLKQDLTAKTFPAWQLGKTLEYTLLYIEQLKNRYFIHDSICKICTFGEGTEK